MFVCCKCCVLSGRGLCDGLITRPEEYYPLWCVLVTSGMRRLKLVRVVNARWKKNKLNDCEVDTWKRRETYRPRQLWWESLKMQLNGRSESRFLLHESVLVQNHVLAKHGFLKF
jgi:hypothetical protein